jgi:hypothetical protein
MLYFESTDESDTEVPLIPNDEPDDNSGMDDTDSEIAEDDEVDDESDTTLT